VGDLVTKEQIEAGIRQILGEVTGQPLPPGLPPDTPLLRGGVGLDSLGATLMLTRVRDRFGVDVADEDLNLDSLASIDTLAAFVANRLISRPAR
jgi:acyl carrier protein